MTILEFREILKQFYARYDTYVKMALKFILALAVFLLLTVKVGFAPQLKNPLISVGLAAFCAFLPMAVMVVFSGIIFLLQAYALSMEVCAVALAVLALLYFLYFRFSPKMGYLLILTPLSFWLGIPYVVPLVMGLIGTPLAILPVTSGILVYYMLNFMVRNTTILTNQEVSVAVEKVTSLLESLTSNKEMMTYIAAFALTILAVYFIRRLSVDYSWQIAIGVGTILNLVINFLGSLIFQLEISILQIILGSLISLLLAFVVQFFVFSVDYTRAERVQFEDDEYYYYVKAIPKNTVAIPEKKVKKIVVQKKSRIKQESEEG